MTGPSKKSPISGPLIPIAVILLLGAGGAYYYFSQPPTDTTPPDQVTPVNPVNPVGPVESSRALVVKELPFLTTENRQVQVDLGEGVEVEASAAPRRTSNPFVQVVPPPSNNSSTATVVTPPTVSVNTTPLPTTPVRVQPLPVPSGGTVTLGNSNTLPSINTVPSVNTGGSTVTTLPNLRPVPSNDLSNPGAPQVIVPKINIGTTVKPRPLPQPTVALPNSTQFTVPEQQTTVLSAPTPVLISALVIPKETPVEPAKENQVLKAANELQLAFSSVVLGPINTAVFTSKNGFVMAETGQKLAGTDIVVQSISQQQVTLQLGEDTLELALDRR